MQELEVSLPMIHKPEVINEQGTFYDTQKAITNLHCTFYDNMELL